MAIANAVNATQSGFQSLTTGGVWNGRTLTAGTGISITNGDGISGNPEISSTGTGGSLAKLYIYDDLFCFASTATSLTGNTNVSATAPSGTLSNTTSLADHPGVFSVIAGSGTNNFGMVSGSTSFTPGGGVASIEWVANLPTLSNATNRYTFVVGFANSQTPTKGCFFKYSDNINSGNWQLISIGAGTTTVNTSVAADTNWHNFKVVINAGNTSVSYYIDGAEVTGSPIATDLPNAVITPTIALVRNAGSGNTFLADLMIFQIDLTNPRPG